MALVKQFYRVNFGLGLDTKTDPKVLSSGKMTVLQNAQFTTTNRLSKRNGFSAVGVTDSSGETIQRLGSAFGQVFGWGDPGSGSARSFYTYNQSITNPTFSAFCPAFNDCTVTTSPVVNNQFVQQQGDSASVNGYILYAWIQSTTNPSVIITPTPYYRIVNSTTGAIVVNDTQVTTHTSSAVRCLVSGNNLLLGYVDKSTNQIKTIAFNTTSAFGQTANTYSNFSITASINWDWSSHTVSSTCVIFMAYQRNLTNIQLVKADCFATQTVSLSITATGGIATIGTVSAYPGSTSTGFRMIYADSANTPTNVPTNTSLTVGTITSGANLAGTMTMIVGQELSTLNSCQIFIQNQNVATTVPMTQGFINQYAINSSGTFSQVTVSSGTYVGLVKPYPGVSIHGKTIIKDDSNIYFWTLFPSQEQGQYILLHFNPTTIFAPAARCLVGQAMGSSQGGQPTVSCYSSSIGSNKYFSSCVVIGQQTSSLGSSSLPALHPGFIQMGSLSNMTVDFGFTKSFHTETLNNQAIVSGGFNALYDGISPTELGFFMYPEGVTVSSTTTSGGGLSAGLYQYICTYEWIDANGNLHRSQTPAAVSVTSLTSTNSCAILNVPTLRATLKQAVYGNRTDCMIGIYRTTVNASPSIFYRVTNQLVLNDPTATNASNVQAITYTDKLSDASLTANQILYTQGGVEDNYTIDGTSVICAGPDRLYASNPNNNGIIHVGKPYNNTDGLAFFPDITVLIPTADGQVTNMIYMDNSLVIFKARSIYVLQGQGPTANGQNNGYAPIQKITGDVGCDGPHSATLYPDGILFKSSKGYYKLGRDFSFSASSNYIGAPVETFNSQSCLRALLREDLNEVRFLLSDNQTILVYNYFFDQWSTIITSATDMAEANGTFYISSATPSIGALVGQETVGTFTDAMTNPTTIPFSIQTGWIALNQLQGCQRIYRVRLLGDFKSSHTLQVQVAYDYESSFNETHTITSTNITTGSSAYQCEVFPLRQKCEAIRFQIADTVLTGEDFDLTDMEIEVGIQPGRRFPLAAGKAF